MDSTKETRYYYFDRSFERRVWKVNPYECRKAYLRYLNNTNWSGPIFQHIMQINQIPSLRVGQFVYGILKGKVIQIDDKRKWMWLSDGSGITRIDITEARIDSIRVSDYELQEIVCGVLCVNQPPFTLQLVFELS